MLPSTTDPGDDTSRYLGAWEAGGALENLRQLGKKLNSLRTDKASVISGDMMIRVSIYIQYFNNMLS